MELFESGARAEVLKCFKATHLFERHVPKCVLGTAGQRAQARDVPKCAEGERHERPALTDSVEIVGVELTDLVEPKRAESGNVSERGQVTDSAEINRDDLEGSVTSE